MKPLADKIRPEEVSDFVGQKHLFGESWLVKQFARSLEKPGVFLFYMN